MIQAILPILNKAIPASAILKLLGEADPKLKRFVGSAISANYAAPQIVDFLKGIVGTSSKEDVQQRASLRTAQGMARPDERAIAKQAQREAIPGNLARGVAALGAGLAGASGIGFPDEEQAQQPSVQQPQESYFSLITGGLDLSNHPNQSVRNIFAQEKQKLDDLQAKGVPFDSKEVKTIEKTLIDLMRKLGVSKGEKFQPVDRGIRQAPGGNQRFFQALDDLLKGLS